MPAAKRSLLRHRLLRKPGGFEGFRMALISPAPHGEAVAEAEYPANFGVQGDSAPEPGAKTAKRQHDFALVSNVVDGRLKLLKGGGEVRPPSPDPLVSLVSHVALTCAENGYHSISG